MRGLGGGVNDDRRLKKGFDDGLDAGAVADVERVLNEPGEVGGEPALVPARFARRTEEHGALIVIEAVDGVAQLSRKIDANFGVYEAGGTGDE